MEDVSIAVIGAGFMGNLLARAASELPYARVIAVADVDTQRAQKVAEPFGCAFYANAEELFERHRPTAVFIATPEFDHLEPTLAAARAGCHVFVEKPIATTHHEAQHMIAACREAGVKLMVGHILRFEPSYALLYSAIREGSIGKFLSAYARRIASINEARRLNGRISPLLYIGVHDIDQMLWYHPVPVKAVYARPLYGRVWEEFKTFDSAWVMIEFEDGALGVHEVGWCLPETWAKWETPKSWGGFGDVRMNVIGSHGNLSLDFTPMDVYGVGMSGWMLPDTRHWPTLHGRVSGAVKNEVEHFLTCILEDKTPLVTGEDGLRALEVVLAAETSIAENKIVSMSSIV